MYLLLPVVRGFESVVAVLKEKNHDVAVPVDFKEFLKYYTQSRTIIAAGKLTVDGIFAWGYCRGRNKQVIAVKGVEPCLASRAVSEEKMLKEIPKQMMFWNQ